MRAYSAGLKAELASPSQRVGRIMSITPVGLPAVYLSSTGADFSYGGNTYLGNPGFVYEGARITDGADPAALQVTIPVSDDGPITPDDVTRGLYADAEVVMRVIAPATSEVSPPFAYKWVVGATTITDDGKARFDIRSGSRMLRELILKKVGPICTANLGDSRCGKDLTAFTDTVTVASVTSLYEFTVTGSSRANGFFDNGAIKFTSGDALNRAHTVRKWTQTTGQVLLWEPLQAVVSVGDTASIHAGCDKTEGAGGCAKFSNIARRQGFSNLPPDDAKFAYEGDVAVSQPVVTNPEPPIYSTGWGAG